jgi:hypothetical protein
LKLLYLSGVMILSILLFVLGSPDNIAAGIICNNQGIFTGASKEEVKNKCGYPIRINKDISGETWTYIIGGCYREFVFSEDSLAKIIDGSLAIDVTRREVTPIENHSNYSAINDYFSTGNENVGALECNIVIHPRDVDDATKIRIKMRDDNKCVVCGGTELLEVDHRRALMNGGTNDEANLFTLCDYCHKIKTGYDNSLRRKRESICRGISTQRQPSPQVPKEWEDLYRKALEKWKQSTSP